MKKKMILISMFLMGLVVWGCGEKSTMKSQIAYVFATAANDGGDSYLQDLDGFVVGDPFPVMKDVSVKGLSV